MSFLEQLTAAKGTLADGRKSTNARNSANFARYKFINAVEAQRELVMAEIEGHHDFRPTKEVYVKDDAGNTVYDEVGRAKKITVESKRVIRWYEKIGGEYYTAFKYGVRDVEIKGAKMFHCGPDLEDVISVYDIVEKAANAGELDVKLDAIAREIGYSRTRRGEAPTRDDNAIQVEEEVVKETDAEPEQDTDPEPEVEPEPVPQFTARSRATQVKPVVRSRKQSSRRA